MAFGYEIKDKKKIQINMEPNELGFYSEKQIRAMKGVLSYSTLKSVVDDPMSLINGREDLSSHRGVTLGSLIDKMVFGEPIDDIAVIESFKVPTASKLQIADEMVKGELEGPVGFLTAARNLKIYEKNKDETVMSKFDDDIKSYVNAKLMTKNEQRFISKDDYALAQRAVVVLKTNRFTAKFFDQDQKDIDVHYQAGLKANFEEFEIKGLFDMFIVHHGSKTIIPCDLKTTGGLAKDFKEAFKRYSYALQAQMYTHLARVWADNYYPDYRVAEFRYVVLSTRDVENPFVFEFNWQNYFDKVVSVYGVKTLTDYLIEYRHITKNQEFVYPAEMVETGKIQLY
jgi:hypothetical protein